MNTRQIVTSESFKPEDFARKAVNRREIINDLTELIFEKKEQIRFNSFETLRIISEEKPEVIYPKWEVLEGLLTHKNNYLKFIGINLIANIVMVDQKGLFEKIFDTYYGILREDVTIAPAYVVRNSWKIVQAKPELEQRITNMLLHLDAIHPGKQLAMIKGEAIETFGKYFELSNNKDGILKFVKDQLDNPSPKARKLAKQFLEKWGERE